MSKKHKQNFNVASYLPQMAKKKPFKRAVVFPYGRDSKGRVSYTHLTFSELDEESSRYAWGFYNFGIKRGMRVLLMVKPSIEFVGLAFALFKIGAVPVLIDPGMGVSNLLKSIKQVKPDAMVAVPLVHIIKSFKKEYFSSVKHSVTVGRKLFWEGTTLDKMLGENTEEFPVAQMEEDEAAAVLFTTGSYIKSYYGINENDVDMPAFPLFALFSAAIGMTCIIPDMNPTKPAKVNPEKIIEAIQNHGVTTTFGSPAIWKRVGAYAVKRNITLPSVKRILMAGAPVSISILKDFEQLLPSGDIAIPYGATEALPIVSISGKERLKIQETAGLGICVGRPLPGVTVKIIKITDDPIPDWKDSLVVTGKGELGEITVKGKVVTCEYFSNEAHTKLAKIYDGNTVWHRMGDIGYTDEDGKIWFCGRKTHRVITEEKTLFTVPCENIFNQHPKVFRSALVGLGPSGKKRPVIIIEPLKGEMPLFANKSRFVKELLELGKKNECTKTIRDVLFYKSFPVDIRHNVKIFRENLAVWAEKKI